MKKIISLLLVLTLMLGLAACGGSNNETTPGGNQPAETQGQSGNAEQTQPQSQQSGFSGEITEEILRSWPETPASDFLYGDSLNYDGIRVDTYLGSDDIVVIPAEIDGKPVVEITSHCFANDSKVRGVVIPDTVTKIEAMFGNNKCIEMVIAEGVQVFGNDSFLYCDALKNVFMGDNVVEIVGMCFTGCESLQELHIPATLVNLDDTAEAWGFSLCPNLTIYGEAGSYIETVANAQGVPFVAE